MDGWTGLLSYRPASASVAVTCTDDSCSITLDEASGSTIFTVDGGLLASWILEFSGS
jgi:hypothetical protein